MAERPLYTLYKNLKAQNYDVPDDYNKFESALTRDGKGGADNRHAIYENLKAQNFDVPSTYERFYSALFEPRSRTSSRAKGGSVPMSAADRARFSAGAAAISASAQQTMNNAGRYNRLKQRKQKQQKDFGRVNLGTHQTPYGGDANNVVKDDFAYNPETGKAGAYVTSDNENVYSLPEAEQMQAILDKQNDAYQVAVDTGEIPSAFDVRDKNGNYDLQENIGKNGTYLTEEGAQKQFDKKLADAYARKKEIEALIAEDNRQHGNPLLSYGASIGASNGRTAEQSDYSNKLATSLALVKQQIGALEAVKQYPTSSWGEDALKALDNTAFTAKTWDFGLTDFATMGQMERIKTKMDNNIPLSGSDKMLLKSKLGADAAAALEDEKMGNVYRWTKIAGQSLPFMADFFLTGGYGGITKGISRGALKFAAKRGMGKVSAAILKNTGIVAGDVIGSYAMAGTEQALKTGADIMQRHLGNLYQDEKGDYKFGTFDENGNLLHEGGESMGTALYKGLTSAMVENYTEKLFGHNYGIKKGAVNFMEKHGMNASAEFFKNIGKSGWYTNSKKWMEKFGINGFAEEVMEEEIGIPLHALLDGEGKVSDLLDAKQQLDIIGGMAIYVGSMYAMGVGSRPVKGIYNRAQYYRFRNKVNVADSDAQNLMGDNWADIKDKIENATNEQMGGVLADILKQRDTMTKEQINAAVNYGVNLMKMRGYNIAKTAEMNAKEITNEPTTPEEQHQADIDNAYSEGHDADDADKHDIQIQQEDQMKTLAAALGISEQQLSAMSYEELESLTGQDDKLDQAIYDYQLSSARYQGVVDDAQDKVDLAAHQAEQRVDMYTDQSRGSVRNATIKASGGLEDYGVYIISGNIATHDDGSIDVSNSDDMILYYDPTTNSVEHADALMFAELGEELPADDVKAQAVSDAKENAIKEVAGIIDGTVEVGSQFNVTDTDGTEHTYEVLADYGDGTAAISIDGNVVENPYSLADLQQMKDLEDQKRLEAAKAEREQMEKERAAQQNQETEQTQPSFDFNQILNDNGNVVLVDVLDKDGNTKYPDSRLFLIRDAGAKAKVVELKSDGTLVPHAVNKEDVATISSMSLDEYKQAMPESSMIEDNSGEESDEDSQLENLGLPKGSEIWMSGDGFGRPKENTQSKVVGIDEQGSIILEDKDGKKWSASFDYINNHRELPPLDENTNIVNEENNQSESNAEENTPAPEQTPAMTLEDGTIVPMLEDGNPDFSKLTAEQTAELYDTQFGEDADSIVSGYVSDAKKALDKASNMTVKGKTFVEQKAAKDAKEKAIADAQAAYDSAIAIRDAYNERQLAKVEDTAEGRKELIEKARRKFARLKSAVKDDAEAVSQLYRETIGSLLHRLYDSTGIDVTDTTPLTAEEYVASNLGAHSLNYEGTETSKGVKQETGLSREDFAKTQLLAADGKGTTIDALVHSLWENRPSNLESLDTQDIRNALIGVLNSGFKASEARNFVENIRIAQAENILEEQKRAQENASYAEQHKAEPEAELEAKSDEKAELKAKSEAKLDNESDNKSNDLSNKTDNEKINDNINDNINVPEDATDENPLGAERDESDLPFSAKENGKQQTTAERAADVEKNKVDDMKVVDNIVGEKTRKAFERLAKMMGANIQWQYSDKLGNGWIQETKDADGNVHRTIFITLDSSITEGAQFIFGHEMTHQIKNLNPAAYNELTQLVLDTYGSDAFDKAVDETMKRYSDAGFSGRARDYYAEEVVADAVGEMIRDLNLAHTLAMKMSHPLLAAIHEILQKIKLAFFGTEYSDVTKNIIRSIEQAYVKTANGQVTNSETGEDVSFSLRQKPEPKKKGIGYKVFVLKDGKLYPPMVANPDGAATPVGVWLDADAAPIAGESKTGRPQVKQGGKGTQGGSGKLAYRPGWHLGIVPYAIQFNRKDAEGNKTLFPKNFVFAEVEYAADVDYQEEARQEGINPSGKYQHSLAGLKHLPTDGYYMYRTNPNPETDPWVITGAMKVNRILTRAEQADLVSKAGREPQQIQEGDIVTDDVVNSINQEIADAPKFSLKKVNDAFNQRLDELVKNPNQKDKILHLGRSSSFLKAGGITDAEIELDFDKFIRKSGDKYKNNHPFAASDLINLPMALAEPIAVFNSTTANDHVVLTELQKDGKNFIVAVRAVEQHRKGGVVLEVNKITSLYPKEERGIVYWINNGRISNVDKEKALHFIEALQPHAGTTITDEELKSAANIINSFETTKGNGEKVDVEAPKTFDEFLNHPSLKFSIKNGQQRKAAEDAYEYAFKLRPNKSSQYALVDMSNPSNSPQYYEKKVLADRWRRFYNKAVHNELDDVYKDAWGNYKLFDLDRPFADQVNEVKGDVPSEFNAPDVVANKNADNESGAEYHEYKQDEPSSITYKDRYKAFKQREANREKTAGLRKERKEVEDVYKSKSEERVEYNKQLMKEYMDEHGLSSENDIPYDVWDNLRSKSFEKYQDELDSLFNKYKDLDKQIKAVAEPRFSLKDEKIKSVAEKFGVNEDDVAMYANAVEKGSTAEAARARANIKRYLLQANEDKISSFKELMKYTVPVNESLKENFGDLDAMIEEQRKQVEAERNAMEAARKRAQEEEEKRQKHLDELSLIPTDELDKRYMDAIANNDESTAREMLDESARRKGYGDVDSDYQGQGAWAAPSNPQYESDEARRADIENSPDVNLEDIALGYSLQPDDYFDNPRAYMNNTAYGLESAHVIKNALDAIKNGEKDVKVKVYRAVPTSVKEGKLRNGDWVTPSKKYAEMHGDNRLEGKYRIIEDEVPANQLWWDGNDANEFGFDDGKEYRYKNAKNNRKLNDLITYDNKGNVIPPSKRFNSRKNDIRFSLAGERGAADMAEDLKSLNTPDEVDDAIKTAIEDMPSGWKMANKKMIHIAQALGENRKAEIAGEEPKFSLKDGTLIKAGTYFSGGGLVEEGLKGIIDPVVAVEYDEKISGVYRNNFGQHIVTADVRDVDPRELVKQIDGEVEYFHASPVCKNYSQAKSNHAEVELDKETAASTAEFINAVKPKVVTIENVKGYKDSDAMKIITDALDANGYTWDADVYNAADYGGYTNRERLIVRAVRDGKLPAKPEKMAHKSGWYEAVADIIPTLTEKKNGVAPWMDIRLKADGIDWRNIDKPLYVMGSAYADGKVPHAFADDLLPTLRTKSGDVIVMPDGKVYRALGRVLARVSGVSDDYKMPFSENLSHTIIGNGIPTQLTEHVIAPLLQNTLRPTTPDDGNTRFSLRYDQFEHDLNQWKKDNNLPKDAQRPTIPQRNAGESAVDFLRRVDEYRKQMALWKTAPTYEQHLLSDDTALGEFNRELQRGSVLKRIAFQDSMLAIRKAQEAIMKEVGVDRLNMAEDAYTAENRSHGKGKNEFEEYNNEFLQPLRKAYHQMKKILGDSYDNVRIYMMAKHGLERDSQMAFKKSLEADYEDVAQRSAAYKAYKGDMNRIINDSDLEFGRVDFNTWRQRDNALRAKYSPSYMDYRYDKNGIAYDYSGLSALFDGSDFEEAAYKLVKDIEDKYVTETHTLWDATNAATKKIIRDGYKAGMMSKDTYQYVRDMYSHYIPLRGWDGTTADQVWDYVGGGKGVFNQTLKKARGRTSIADDPIAYIENMAESGILLNNKNWVKQHLMLLAQNHPTSLLTLSKAWYVKSTDANGNEEWIPATPQITSQMDSNQVKAAIDAFEKRMEKMAQTGDATQKRDGLNIAYPQTHSEEREHEVRVMKDGEEYVIYVNGDPQLAQAMNNTRAHRVREIQSGKLDRAAAWLGRKMAAAYTSLSPLFIPSNYFRDLTMTLASTAIREDAKYNYLLRKNLATSWNLGFMLRDYQSGKLREKVSNGNATQKEQMFYDFMMNGGETGFVSSLDVEDLKKKFKNDLKDLDRWKTNPVKVGHTIMDSIEFLNRAIEDSNRFAVYMTSIQYGRSIDEAVNDAKDVTLNFNRKGTGEHSWQTIRNLYLFINPAVQSLQTLGALAKHHPFKFTAVTASWLASGVLVPIVNVALMQLGAAFLGGDGDDDKDWYKDISKKYWQFSKWDRRNNFIMWVPTTHEFVKIPLAQEFRAFYGLGDMIASKMMGGELAEESWEDYGLDLVGQVVDMLPLDPTGYDGNIAVSLMPNAIRPVFELAFNVDFTGKPLFKDTEYNKYDPNFTKAYVGTPDWLVRASRMMNSIGNDYPNVQQNKWDALGDPRYNLNNPAVVDHVLSSYLGGAYTMGSQVLGLLTKSLNDRKEIKVADIPLVSKFVSNPDDRPVSKKQGDEFWDKKEYYDRASNTISKLKKQAKIDGDYSLLERFYGSEEYKTYKLYEKDVKDYKEARKKERAEESGDEYRPHQLNAEDIYNNHATPMDEFEDMKLKQLFEKLNSFKTRYDSIVDNAPNESDGYYNTNKAAIDAIDEISLDKQEISELKKGFLDDGKDAYNAEDMKQIRDLRKKILAVLEKANKVVVANQKAKTEK